MTVARGVAVELGSAALLATAGCAGSPSIFHTYGSYSRIIAPLGWTATLGLGAVGIAVLALLLVAILRRNEPDEDPYDYHGRGARWLAIGGLAFPAVVVSAFAVYSLATLRTVESPRGEPAGTIRVTANQWWWRVDYLDRGGDTEFTTANEIHLPAGRPFRVLLDSGDVIHSFWVPELAGKTDAIPGRTNSTWIEGDEPGVYHGQCAEFCGASHANMLIRVVVEDSAAFREWAAAQAEPARPDSAGMALFDASGCSACHRIAGTLAQGTTGPDLTHVGSRATLAAGILGNTPGNLAAWLRSPDSLKAQSRMPDLNLSEPAIEGLVSFLEGLK